MEGRLRLYLTLIVSASALIFAAIVFFSPDETRGKILIEASKIFLQLMLLGIVGGFVKWVFDQSSKARDREVTLNDFRKESVRRIVGATNTVRRAPLLIESHRSKKTYGEQIRSLIDARLELSLLRHDLETTAEAFSNLAEIRPYIRMMEEHLSGLIEEWKEVYRDLPEPPSDAWPTLQNLPKLADLRSGKSDSGFSREYIDSYINALGLMRKNIWKSVGVRRPGKEDA